MLPIRALSLALALYCVLTLSVLYATDEFRFRSVSFMQHCLYLLTRFLQNKTPEVFLFFLFLFFFKCKQLLGAVQFGRLLVLSL